MGGDIKVRLAGAIAILGSAESVANEEQILDALRTLRALLKEGHNRIIWDLSGVRYISSRPGGIPSFVNAFVAARNSGGELVLVGLTPRVRDILQLTKLIEVFKVFETVPEALAYFGAPQESNSDA